MIGEYTCPFYHNSGEVCEKPCMRVEECSYHWKAKKRIPCIECGKPTGSTSGRYPLHIRGNEKTTSIYVYEKWWRSDTLIKLFNERIDPVVKDVCKKQQRQRIRNVASKINRDGHPPVEAPSWTLNTVALMRENRDQSKIVIYDPNTKEKESEGEGEDNTDEDDDDDKNDLIIDTSVNFFKRKPSKSFTPITFEYLQHKRNIYEGYWYRKPSFLLIKRNTPEVIDIDNLQ
ncbi:hypothetical protein Glove_251g8 [Diversispora epigaea]|uniref:Uncharacterized protein n=1 Tax=Diversispora epigaea TaxID=1348612 RepID=A0A397IGN7_9GLOM|nr:hypothetical protein Glove_251g8 [Diversispora epigaea]